MLILGITGGVGSGKSRILNELEISYGAYIVEADKLAHKLMEPGQPIYERIVNEFGSSILSEGKPYPIDRKKFADIVFHDNDKLNTLNSITHPAVKQWIITDIKTRRKMGTSLYVIEAALLIQDGYKEICDEIWYIYADEEERTKRLMKQRGYSKERCMAMFQSQDSEDYYKKYADYTINNQFDYENSSKQLKDRLNKLL